MFVYCVIPKNFTHSIDCVRVFSTKKLADEYKKYLGRFYKHYVVAETILDEIREIEE